MVVAVLSVREADERQQVEVVIGDISNGDVETIDLALSLTLEREEA